MSEDTASDEKRKSLYTYWESLPFFKHVDSSNWFRIDQSKVKSFIVKYIRDGREDDFGRTHKLARRHAFNAKELHAAFQKNAPNPKNAQHKKYSISNFHFHIKSLVQDGYLQKIATMLEGRQYQSYYGRTAIAFEPRFDEQLTKTLGQNIFGPLKAFIQELNPEMDKDTIGQLVDENLRLSADYYFRTMAWMQAHYPKIYSAKIDMLAFLQITAQYAFFHQALAENLKSMGSLLKLDHIMDYDRYEATEKKENNIEEEEQEQQ